MKSGFIQQTAEDYDMSYSEAEYIYKHYYESGEFYEKLEEYIKERRNN